MTFTPFSCTAVIPEKLLPDTATSVPGLPEEGLKELMTGGNTTVNTGPLAVPSGFATDTAPEVEPAATVNRTFPPPNTVKVWARAFNLTEVVVERLVPLTVTTVPTGPDVGLMEEMPGGFGRAALAVRTKTESTAASRNLIRRRLKSKKHMVYRVVR